MSQSKQKRKFKKVIFKLSYAEYEYLIKCSTLEKISPNKFIKQHLRKGFEELKPRVTDWDKQKQPENQLALFDFNLQPQQSSMLADEGFLYSTEKQ
jgi:hypothetical protein